MTAASEESVFYLLKDLTFMSCEITLRYSACYETDYPSLSEESCVGANEF